MNSDISHLISRMGHKQTLVIADAGLPIPEGVTRIDLALERGIPRFLSVLDVVLDELDVERYTLAEEIRSENPHIFEGIKRLLPQVEVCFLPHSSLKELCKNSLAVIRTGEASPYSNIILQSGVAF